MFHCVFWWRAAAWLSLVKPTKYRRTTTNVALEISANFCTFVSMIDLNYFYRLCFVKLFLMVYVLRNKLYRTLLVGFWRTTQQIIWSKSCCPI